MCHKCESGWFEEILIGVIEKDVFKTDEGNSNNNQAFEKESDKNTSFVNRPFSIFEVLTCRRFP
jgi:hypothetical protein